MQPEGAARSGPAALQRGLRHQQSALQLALASSHPVLQPHSTCGCAGKRELTLDACSLNSLIDLAKKPTHNEATLLMAGCNVLLRCVACISMSGRAQAPGAPEEVDANPSEVAAQSASKLRTQHMPIDAPLLPSMLQEASLRACGVQVPVLCCRIQT